MNDTLLCQSCLERGLESGEVIGLYLGQPICDSCLAPIMENKANIQEEGKEDKSIPIEEKKAIALKLLDRFEVLFEQWPLTADETLQAHEDFYNHRPPAVENCSIEELIQINSRRKGLLYAIRHKDERWSTEIEVLKRTTREQANLTGIQKSIKEKKKTPSAVSKDAKAKLAKAMGISLAELEAMGQKSREAEFGKVLKSSPANPAPPNQQPTSSRGILGALQAGLKKNEVKARKRNPITGKWED